MSGHTTEVHGQINDRYKWWVICEICGPLEWSHDPDEAHRLADAHAAQ